MKIRGSSITMSVYVNDEVLATMMPSGWIDTKVSSKYKTVQAIARKAIRKLPVRTLPQTLAREIRQILLAQ